MKTWKLSITVKVADSWVADGFNLSERIEEIEEQIANILPFAYGHEVEIKAKITFSPKATTIEALQNGELEIKD